MKEEFNCIIKIFEKLTSLGYIKSNSNNIFNAAGLTLESFLGKQLDNMFFPDYKGIEIKCTQRFSRYDISLFTLSFDGPSLFESNYLLRTYGKDDKNFPEYKKLIVNLKLNKKVLVYKKYYFELKIDYENKKIFIKIYDISGNFIEDRAFIDFFSIEQRLSIKLGKLALFYASKKVIDEVYYFRYYMLKCFICRGIDAFIKALEDGYINANLQLRFARGTNDFGKNKNKNIQFTIKKECIDKLFIKIYSDEN